MGLYGVMVVVAALAGNWFMVAFTALLAATYAILAVVGDEGGVPLKERGWWFWVAWAVGFVLLFLGLFVEELVWSWVGLGVVTVMMGSELLLAYRHR